MSSSWPARTNRKTRPDAVTFGVAEWFKYHPSEGQSVRRGTQYLP